MFKKTITSLGIAAAATTGAALFMGSPASAQTTPASAQVSVAHVLPITTADRVAAERWEHGFLVYYLIHHPRHHVVRHNVPKHHSDDHHKPGKNDHKPGDDHEHHSDHKPSNDHHSDHHKPSSDHHSSHGKPSGDHHSDHGKPSNDHKGGDDHKSGGGHSTNRNVTKVSVKNSNTNIAVAR